MIKLSEDSPKDILKPLKDTQNTAEKFILDDYILYKCPCTTPTVKDTYSSTKASQKITTKGGTLARHLQMDTRDIHILWAWNTGEKSM